MDALIVFFSPELTVLSVIMLAVLAYLLLHIRSIIRNTLGAAALLFAWATQAGFVGFIVYIAAWVFHVPRDGGALRCRRVRPNVVGVSPCT
jgi:hypothetical protein